MHFSALADVIVQFRRAGLVRGKHSAQLRLRPGEIIAVVVQSLVSILAGVESATRLIGQHLVHPRNNPFRRFAEKRLARHLIAVQKILQQLRIVVGHFFEVRHAPAFVHRVAVKPAAELVVNAS